MKRLWPLTGREVELRTMAAALRPGAAGIVLAGPAGVGKTRLAREALTRPAASHARVVWAHGSTAARPYPLGAFAGVVELDPGESVQTVRRTVEQLTRSGPVVLAVDDAHLIDELSALVVHRLVTQRLATVVVTLRAGEPAPDPVTALWKDDHLPRLDLDPLAADTATALVATVLGGPVESRSALRLWSLTEGSPLFLRHLLAGEIAADRITPASGIWCWTEEPGISQELTTILEQQIGHLAASARDVIDVVSLAEPVELGMLQRLTSPESVEEAEQRDLIRIDDAVGALAARLSHPLYGEVRRSVMGQLRARRLRGLVATALDPRDDLLSRAVLWLDSDLDPDPELFLAAAQQAMDYLDLPLAERLARAAAHHSGAWDARLVHASTLSWLSCGDEAETILRSLAETAPDGGRRAMVHLFRTGNLLWTVADAEQAGAALAAAEAEPDPGTVGPQVTAMRAAYAASTGDTADALASAREALSTPQTDLGTIIAASALSAVAAVSGRMDLLADAADAGGFAREELPTVIPAFGLADWQILGLRLAGRPRDAEQIAMRMQEASADLPGPAHLMGLVLSGHAALALGHLRDAITALREAWAGLASSGHEFRFRCRTLLATAFALSGQADRAGPLLADLTRDQHPAYRLYLPDDLLARAWGAATAGAQTRAIDLALESVQLSRTQESPAYEALGWQTVLQFGGDVDLAALEQLQAGGQRATVVRAHAGAAANSDGAALLDVADSWERLGDLIAAGDAAAQAAITYRRQGRQGSALSAAARGELFAARSGAKTPALLAAAQPLPLTTREREIATLAARGLSNRDIAEQLTLSVRTVEGHLYRLSAKLGIDSRSELVGILDLGKTE